MLDCGCHYLPHIRSPEALKSVASQYVRILSLFVSYDKDNILYPIFAIAVSNSARQKKIVMESKIMIDINYASRDPQIVIHQKESDDPRDKLVSMLTGHAMPGVRDGYCRIERYPGTEMIVITPLHPVDAIKHIPTIAKFAEENAACDTSEVPARLREIIDSEYKRLHQ